MNKFIEAIISVTIGIVAAVGTCVLILLVTSHLVDMSPERCATEPMPYTQLGILTIVILIALILLIYFSIKPKNKAIKPETK